MAVSSRSAHLDFSVIAYRIRQRRKELGLSTREVAELAGVARQTVVRIENGLPCHFATLEKVRHSIHLFTDMMLRPVNEPVNCAIQRAHDLKWTVSKQKQNYQKQIVDDDLTHVNDDADRKRLGMLGLQPFFTAIFESVLIPGMSSQALMEFHQPSWVDSHVGEEFIYCLRGPLTITVDGIAHRLETGDSTCFDGNLPHQYAPSEPIGAKDLPVLILIVVTNVPAQRNKKYK